MSIDNSLPLSDAANATAQCRHLRSKGMFITGCTNPAVEDGQVGDGYCWCGQTQHTLGPDDDFVGRPTCVPGRACFVAMV